MASLMLTCDAIEKLKKLSGERTNPQALVYPEPLKLRGYLRFFVLQVLE